MNKRINIKIIIFKYIMKYLNVFDNKSALDSSVTSFNHGDGAYVFGVKLNRELRM